MAVAHGRVRQSAPAYATHCHCGIAVGRNGTAASGRRIRNRIYRIRSDCGQCDNSTANTANRVTLALVVITFPNVVNTAVEGTEVCFAAVELRSSPIVSVEAKIVTSAIVSGRNCRKTRGIIGGEIIARSTGIIVVTVPVRLGSQCLRNTIDMRPVV